MIIKKSLKFLSLFILFLLSINLNNRKVFASENLSEKEPNLSCKVNTNYWKEIKSSNENNAEEFLIKKVMNEIFTNCLGLFKAECRGFPVYYKFSEIQKRIFFKLQIMVLLKNLDLDPEKIQNIIKNIENSNCIFNYKGNAKYEDISKIVESVVVGILKKVVGIIENCTNNISLKIERSSSKCINLENNIKIIDYEIGETIKNIDKDLKEIDEKLKEIDENLNKEHKKYNSNKKNKKNKKNFKNEKEEEKFVNKIKKLVLSSVIGFLNFIKDGEIEVDEKDGKILIKMQGTEL